MGEKRKARMSNNERKSKKEKKLNNSVIPTVTNDDIEDNVSVHSNTSTADSNSQQPSIAKENTNPEEIEESETIPPIDGEDVTNENQVESTPTTNDDDPKITNESNSTTKSWWSSLIRLFHFRNNTNENKTQINNSTDPQTSPHVNGNYLSNVKCRRSLHDESLVK